MCTGVGTDFYHGAVYWYFGGSCMTLAGFVIAYRTADISFCLFFRRSRGGGADCDSGK